jgi:uncharacterized protein (DUF2164 family)
VAKRKYEDVVHALPRWTPTNEPSRQEKLDAVAAALKASPEGDTVATLAGVYARYRRMREELEKQEAEVNLYLEVISEQMALKFEEQGVEALRTGTFKVSVYLEPYASVEDRDTFRQWCLDEGLERSLQLPWQTLNSLTKARLLDGRPEPAGVTVYAKPKIRLEKA